MHDAGASAHALNHARTKFALVAGRILVSQRPLDDPGDDLHVAVKVRVDASARFERVVVVDEQCAVRVTRQIEGTVERKGIASDDVPRALNGALLSANDPEKPIRFEVHKPIMALKDEGCAVFWVMCMCAAVLEWALCPFLLVCRQHLHPLLRLVERAAKSRSVRLRWVVTRPSLCSR